MTKNIKNNIPTLSLNQLELFFELIPIAISVTTIDTGEFIYINKNFEKLFVCKRKDIIGKKSTDLKIITINDRAEYLQKTAKTGRVSNLKVNLSLLNSKKINALISIEKINVNNQIYNITTTTDVTEKNNSNKEIKNLNKKLDFENLEKQNRADELGIANIELAHQKTEKQNRSNELGIANIELAHQNQEKQNRANELGIANIELAHQNQEKQNRANELGIANIELAYQQSEKSNRADELLIANKELSFQDNEKLKRANELIIKNDQLQAAQTLGQFGSWDWDVLTDKIEWSDELYKIFGVTPSKYEFNFDNYLKNIHPDDINIVQKTINQAMLDLKPYTVYHRIILQNGDIRDIKGSGKVYVNKKNKIIRMSGIAQDITEKKLAQQQVYSRSLIEASRDPLFTISLEGKITDVNKATIMATDKKYDDLIGSYFYNYFTEPEKAKKTYEQVFEKGFVVDFPLVLKDHHLTDVLFNGAIYKDENNIVIGAVVVARDITQQKKLERNLTEYKHLFNENLDFACIASADGVFEIINNTFSKILGFSESELIGNSFLNFVHPDDIAPTIKTVENLKKGVPAISFKNRYITKSGEFVTLDWKSNFNKKTQKIYAIARDITAQIKLEQELTEAKIYAEIAANLAEDARVNAEEALKSKQQFLSNMSHEIRTPMNAIIGFTKVFLKTELTAKQKEFLLAIKMSGDAMIVLINDILDLAKVDSGQMTFEKTPFKLALSITSMLHLFETKVQEKNLKLNNIYDTAIPEVVVGDAIRLNQIILNLVSNAVKFTTDGQIDVSTQMLSQDEHKVSIKFSVTDTGIGIQANKISKIFENFQQATNTTSRLYGGTGLGLAIVKQLVEGQGGKITINSKINKGSTFSFVLDFEKTDAEAILEPEILELNTDVKDIKILVVEDMELNQLLMKTLLDDFGFECDITANGKLAIEKLKTKTYDIILMDLQMPEMNGFEATEYIRKKLKLTIPIIALTADVTTVDVEKCRVIGMNDYISKPVDERLLYSKLIAFARKPVAIIEHIAGQNPNKDTIKYVDMSYLTKLTKSDPHLMSQMINAYLEQTPPLISAMKKSLVDKDWKMLQSAVHKMIPSFAVVGLAPNIQEIAQRIQEYAFSIEISEEIHQLVIELEKVCTQSCEELQVELKNLKL